MRILLDENMPAKVTYDFGEEHEVRTVKDMQWLGRKMENFWDWQLSIALT